MYEVRFTESAARALGKLEKGTRERIILALERIRIRPEGYLTRLVGDNAYKLRVGDYRVIVDLDRGGLVVLVLRIAHRKNVYGI